MNEPVATHPPASQLDPLQLGNGILANFRDMVRAEAAYRVVSEVIAGSRAMPIIKFIADDVKNPVQLDIHQIFRESATADEMQEALSDHLTPWNDYFAKQYLQRLADLQSGASALLVAWGHPYKDPTDVGAGFVECVEKIKETMTKYEPAWKAYSEPAATGPEMQLTLADGQAVSLEHIMSLAGQDADAAKAVATELCKGRHQELKGEIERCLKLLQSRAGTALKRAESQQGQ